MVLVHNFLFIKLLFARRPEITGIDIPTFQHSSFAGEVSDRSNPAPYTDRS